MNDDGLSTKDKDKLRSYFRSKRFGVLSWTAIALLVASVVFPQYGRRLLWAAVASWFVAMLPMLPLVSKARNSTIDLQEKGDRRYLLFVAIYVGGTILLAILYTIYRVNR